MALDGARSRAGGGLRSPRSPRIEARSADLLAVGTVQGDRMTIHLSRILDNAPVRDAVVASYYGERRTRPPQKPTAATRCKLRT